MNVLLLTSLSDISAHIHVATSVTIVWCLFSFAFALNKKETFELICNKELPVFERLREFFKSDLSIPFVMFVIFIVIVIKYYI